MQHSREAATYVCSSIQGAPALFVFPHCWQWNKIYLNWLGLLWQCSGKHVLSCHSALCKLDFLNRNLISSFIRMPTVQEHSFKNQAGCQTGRQLLWIKVTILQWFHLLVALVTHVKQSNTTAQRDNLIAVDLWSVGLWREEYEFIGCISSNKANHIQVCMKRCSCSTAFSSCSYAPYLDCISRQTHTYMLCRHPLVWFQLECQIPCKRN